MEESVKKLTTEVQDIKKIFSTTLVGENAFPEAIKKMHHKTNQLTFGLMVSTIALALTTGFLWWETRNAARDANAHNIESNEQLNNQKQAEFSYTIWHDFQDFMYNDTFVNKYYYNEDNTTRPGQIDSNTKYRKSICRFLNYFETLYSLYKFDKVNQDIVKTLFENSISRAYNKKIVQDYIKYKRDKSRSDRKDARGFKDSYQLNDTLAAFTFDALSLWAGKFQIDMTPELRAINQKDEKYYRWDEKPTDSFYKHLAKNSSE